MQKDFHHDLILLTAFVYAGFTAEQAAALAWASMYVDENVTPDEYGIATAVDYNLAKLFTNAVQQFTIISFHALPGDDPSNKWIVTPNCKLAQLLLSDAVSRSDLIALALAKHGLGDTFSHQTFTGWQDNVNRNPSLNVLNFVIPRILHAEFLHEPDDIGAVWERHGVKINNKVRAKAAIRESFIWMRRFLHLPCDSTTCDDFVRDIEPFFKIKKYDDRKKWAQKKSGLGSYSDYKPTQEQLIAFARAARRQVSMVMDFVA